MHLKVSKRGDRQYLSVVQNYREGGATKTKTIESIGYADEFAHLYDDPVEHFRAYVRQLNERAERGQEHVSIQLSRDAIIPTRTGTTQFRLGCAIALGYLDALGTSRYFAKHAHSRSMPSATARVFEMLSAERMLHVASKWESWQRRASFPRECQFSFEETYASLEWIGAHAQDIAAHMARAYEDSCGSYDLSRVYLVANSFPFVVADEQQADVAESGSLVQDVAVGLVLDSLGMPLGYRVLKGGLTPAGLLEGALEVRESFCAQRVVVVVGRLPDAPGVMRALGQAGVGFVVYRPLESEGERLARWAADTRGYAVSESGNWSMKTRVRNVDLGEVSQLKDVVLKGRDYTLRIQRSASGASVSSSPATSSGSVCVSSTETGFSGAAIFHLYRELWRTNEPFQVMESDFWPAPYPIDQQLHIQAHFVLCFAAFFALRLLRVRMGYAFNAAQTADALLRMEGIHLSQNWYLFSYRSAVSDSIEDAVGLERARRLRPRADIRHATACARKSAYNAG